MNALTVASVTTDKVFRSVADLRMDSVRASTATVVRSEAAEGCAVGDNGELKDAADIDWDEDRSPPPGILAGPVEHYNAAGEKIGGEEVPSGSANKGEFSVLTLMTFFSPVIRSEIVRSPSVLSETTWEDAYFLNRGVYGLKPGKSRLSCMSGELLVLITEP